MYCFKSFIHKDKPFYLIKQKIPKIYKFNLLNF